MFGPPSAAFGGPKGDPGRRGVPAKPPHPPFRPPLPPTFGPTEGQNEQWREAHRRRQRQNNRIPRPCANAPLPPVPSDSPALPPPPFHIREQASDGALYSHAVPLRPLPPPSPWPLPTGGKTPRAVQVRIPRDPVPPLPQRTRAVVRGRCKVWGAAGGGQRPNSEHPPSALLVTHTGGGGGAWELRGAERGHWGVHRGSAVLCAVFVESQRW